MVMIQIYVEPTVWQDLGLSIDVADVDEAGFRDRPRPMVAPPTREVSISHVKNLVTVIPADFLAGNIPSGDGSALADPGFDASRHPNRERDAN